MVEEMSCGQDGADLAPSVELPPARRPLQRQAGRSAAQISSLAFGGEAGSILVLPVKEQGSSVEGALLKPSLIAPFYAVPTSITSAALQASLPALTAAQPSAARSNPEGHFQPRNSILRNW